MVMMAPPIFEAIEAARAAHPADPLRILLTPQGERFTQERAETFAKARRLMLIAGRYEGFDERVRSAVDIELSIGDVVLSGGELPALVVIDAVTRLLPGAIGARDGAEHESFQPAGSEGRRLLEYPQYTRPREYRGMWVPEVLLSGDHGKVARWREEQARKRTEQRRPDLLADIEGDQS
jgi:tRNA (guanine37-N1)-methyltransferase